MTHHKLKNISEDADEEQVRQMLAGLKRVAAPNDFDFKLKARIAQGRPESRPGSMVWAMRFVLPVLLLAVVGIIAVTSGLIPIGTDVATDSGREPALETEGSAVAQETRTDPMSGNLAESAAVPAAPSPGRGSLVSARPAGSRTASRRATPVAVSRGGSIDVGTSVEEPIFPKGLDPNTPVKVNDKAVETAPLQTKVILSLLGIDAAYDGSQWKAASVKQHSIGERAGVKSGDVIEAVNDLPVGAATEFKSPFSGKSVTVKREGRSVRLGLSP